MDDREREPATAGGQEQLGPVRDEQARRRQFAWTSLILGLLVGPLLAMANWSGAAWGAIGGAIAFGHYARAQLIDVRLRRVALAGLLLGWLQVAALIVWAVWALTTLPA